MDYFDLHRERVFEKIYDFERKIFEKYGDEFYNFAKIQKNFSEKNPIKHYIYFSFLEKEKNIWLPSSLPLGNANEVSEFRNKLGHNQFPYSEALKKYIAFDENGQKIKDDALLNDNVVGIVQPVLSPKILNTVIALYDVLLEQIK
jgi:hypothetical protein